MWCAALSDAVLHNSAYIPTQILAREVSPEAMPPAVGAPATRKAGIISSTGKCHPTLWGSSRKRAVTALSRE